MEKNKFAVTFPFVNEETGAISVRYVVYFNSKEEKEEYVKEEYTNTLDVYRLYAAAIEKEARFYLSNELTEARMAFATKIKGKEAFKY